MTLKEFLAAIADAIRGKEGSTEDIPAPEFPKRIEAIQTGVTLPTLTNPGAAADLCRGKQLISQSGSIVEGSVLEVTQGTELAMSYYDLINSDDNIVVRGSIVGNKLFRDGCWASITFPKSGLDGMPGIGSASSAPVTEDVTVEATSVAGLVTFTVSKPISKVCAITFAVEDANYYGYCPYLYLLNSSGKFIKYHVAERSTGYFIAIDDDGLTSGELISENTVTYGFSTKSGWKNSIPAGSFITATITYVPA